MAKTQTISRATAKALGLTRFFTGEPCKKAGHISPRKTCNYQCIECNREAYSASRQPYREARSSSIDPTVILITRSEAKAKGLTTYMTGIPCKHGHVASRRVRNGVCTTCFRISDQIRRSVPSEKRSQKSREWRNNNTERHKANQRDWYMKNKDYVSQKNKERYYKDPKQAIDRSVQWTKDNREKLSETRRAAYARDPERFREASKRGRVKHKNYYRAYRASYRKACRAQGGILTDSAKAELELIYANCPEGMHVDHIYPLKGKNSSGLHVPWNLQYLTPQENQAKHNHIINDTGWYTAFLERPSDNDNSITHQSQCA